MNIYRIHTSLNYDLTPYGHTKHKAYQRVNVQRRLVILTWSQCPAIFVRQHEPVITQHSVSKTDTESKRGKQTRRSTIRLFNRDRRVQTQPETRNSVHIHRTPRHHDHHKVLSIAARYSTSTWPPTSSHSLGEDLNLAQAYPVSERHYEKNTRRKRSWKGRESAVGC
jgi:hypothetical protein